MGGSTRRCVSPGTEGHQVTLRDTRYLWKRGDNRSYVVAWVEGESLGRDGGHGWRVRGWERKCGGRRKGEPGTLKSN